MDIKHVLSRNPMRRYITIVEASRRSESAVKWIAVEGGTVSVGRDDEGFSFDNERPRHIAYVSSFEIADRP